MRLLDVAHIALFGNVDIGSALMRECFDKGIPVLWFTAGGWFSGVAQGMPRSSVGLRMRQHRAAMIGDPRIPGAIVAGKIRNQRTLVRRHAGKQEAAAVLAQLAKLANQADGGTLTLPSLLGVEGTAARLYFEWFARLLSPRAAFGEAPTFGGRNRRPPKDPVNALLSFVYALLVKDCTVALLAAGLDPFVGLYHRPRFGRPALALDLAEEMRPLIGDSTVLTAVNNGEVTAGDFVSRAGGVAMTTEGRKKVVAAYERRMRTELRHPLFEYTASYRRTLEIQARLLAAVLADEIEQYRPLTTRQSWPSGPGICSPTTSATRDGCVAYTAWPSGSGIRCSTRCSSATWTPWRSSLWLTRCGPRSTNGRIASACSTWGRRQALRSTASRTWAAPAMFRRWTRRRCGEPRER